MVQSQLLAALAVLGTQELSTPEPLNPFTLGREAYLAGNPLARFAEMLKREKEFTVDEMGRSNYWQARSTVAASLGDIVEANRSWQAGVPTNWHNFMPTSPLEGMRPQDAVDHIARAADRHRWIMLGEEHVRPQTRSILIPLLRALRKKGFTTFAAETFNDDVAKTQRQGYASLDTGMYTADPVFAAGVREAIRLGYRLVPYEHIEQPKEVPADDPEFRQNFREAGQAQKLKERIFDRDPSAKVIVWAGRAHVYEGSQKSGTGEWRPMAHVFKKITGQDPYSVYLATYSESNDRASEPPLYKWATDRGLVKRPTVFVDRQGKAFGQMFDAQVFFPRTNYVQGRPDWLMRELGRRPVAIPAGLVKPTGLQLVQAFAVGEPVTAIPVDQIVLRRGDALPALMLPSGPVLGSRPR